MSEGSADCTVAAVNVDGTVTVTWGGTIVPSLQASPSYWPRAIGDRVAVQVRNGVLHHVIGQVAGLPGGGGWSVGTSAPSEPGWVQASEIWVDPATGRVLYVQAPPTPPTTTTPGVSGTHTVPSVQMRTWRSGVVQSDVIAQHGTYESYGPDTGAVWWSSAALADLSGRTLTRATVEVTRLDGGGMMGAVPLHIGVHTGSVSSTAPSISEVFSPGSLIRNQTRTFDIPTAWVSSWISVGSGGIGLLDPSDYLALTAATLYVDWST